MVSGTSPDLHRGQLLVVDAKMKISVFLKNANGRWGPFCLGGFDRVHGHHSIYLLLSNSACSRLYTVLCWMNWSAICIYTSIRFCTTVIEPSRPSHMLFNCVSMLKTCRDMQNTLAVKLDPRAFLTFKILSDSSTAVVIQLFVGAFKPVIAHSINGRIGIKYVSSGWYRSLLFQHVQLIIY